MYPTYIPVGESQSQSSTSTVIPTAIAGGAALYYGDKYLNKGRGMRGVKNMFSGVTGPPVPDSDLDVALRDPSLTLDQKMLLTQRMPILKEQLNNPYSKLRMQIKPSQVESHLAHGGTFRYNPDTNRYNTWEESPWTDEPIIDPNTGKPYVSYYNKQMSTINPHTGKLWGNEMVRDNGALAGLGAFALKPVGDAYKWMGYGKSGPLWRYGMPFLGQAAFVAAEAQDPAWIAAVKHAPGSDLRDAAYGNRVSNADPSIERLQQLLDKQNALKAEMRYYGGDSTKADPKLMAQFGILSPKQKEQAEKALQQLNEARATQEQNPYTHSALSENKWINVHQPNTTLSNPVTWLGPSGQTAYQYALPGAMWSLPYATSILPSHSILSAMGGLPWLLGAPMLAYGLGKGAIGNWVETNAAKSKTYGDIGEGLLQLKNKATYGKLNPEQMATQLAHYRNQLNDNSNWGDWARGWLSGRTILDKMYGTKPDDSVVQNLMNRVVNKQ